MALPGDHRAAGRAGRSSAAAPTLAMAVFGVLIAPGVFRLIRASVDRGARGALRRRGPGLRASATPASCAGTSCRWCVAPTIIQVVPAVRHRHRHPGRPGVPRPRLGEPGQLGRDAQRRLPEHLLRPRCCCGPALAIVADGRPPSACSATRCATRSESAAPAAHAAAAREVAGIQRLRRRRRPAPPARDDRRTRTMRCW